MAAAWDDEWDNFTQTIQVLIDNEEYQYERVIRLATAILQTGKSAADARIGLASVLKKVYGENLVSRHNPASKNFSVSLAGSLLLEVVGQVNWHGLAEHYLEIARKRMKE